MPRPKGPNAKENRYPLQKTKFPGVSFIMGTSPATKKPEKIFYISYYKNGRRSFEKAGREGKPESMTPTKANAIRTDRMRGVEPSNRERREAEEAARKAEAGRWTIGKLWEEYIKQRFSGEADYSDKANYENHLKDAFGAKEPSDLLPLDIDRIRVKLLKTLAPGTVAKILGLLRRIVNFGENKQLAPGPGFKITLPKVNNERTEFLTDAQMAAYIKTCREWPDPQAGNFQLLELYTGMRRGEVWGLKWADVDLDRGFLTIRDPKGGTDQTIPLSDAAHALLEAHPHAGVNPYVFAGEMGGARGLKQIGDASRKIRTAAKLPESFRPNHGLRHAFASHLASSGEVDLYTLQRLMTHKSPMMTQRYAHLRDETLKRGADVMGRIAAKTA
jgi:integrase